MSTTLLYVPGGLLPEIENHPNSSSIRENDGLDTICHRLQRYCVFVSKKEVFLPYLALCHMSSLPEQEQQDSFLASFLPTRSAARLFTAADEPMERNLTPRDDAAPQGSIEDATGEPDSDSDSDSIFDTIDLENCKNCPDYDPNQEPEVYEDSDGAESWTEADSTNPTEGLCPRLYERLNISKVKNHIVSSKYYDKSEITRMWDRVCTTRHSFADCSCLDDSTLAPYLLLFQTPFPTSTEVEGDVAFTAMFHRYAYLTSHERYVRTSAYKQRNESFPRYLLVQEFQEFWTSWNLTLKKNEAKHWWQKHGWHGVKVEFFKLCSSA